MVFSIVLPKMPFALFTNTFCFLSEVRQKMPNVIYLPTLHGKAPEELIIACTCIEDQIEIWSVGFCEGGITGEPGEKPSGTNNKLNPHMMPEFYNLCTAAPSPEKSRPSPILGERDGCTQARVSLPLCNLVVKLGVNT